MFRQRAKKSKKTKQKNQNNFFFVIRLQKFDLKVFKSKQLTSPLHVENKGKSFFFFF